MSTPAAPPTLAVFMNPPGRGVSVGKILTFLGMTIVGSLLQLWLLALVLLVVTRAAPSLSILLGKGGLFFFATSLVASSVLNLADKHPLSSGTADFNMTMFVGALAALGAVATYTSVLTQAQVASPQLQAPFSDPEWIWAQIGCATAALMYALYVAVRTGRFLK